MEHHLSTVVTARYFTHGNPSAKTLIVALHGYGQLASYFIKKFEFLDPDTYYVVVPEAQHRFYLNGTEGRVGASWMTKEDRETDIRNYIVFLDNVLLHTTKNRTFDHQILLGFSQGGATASRLMVLGKHKFDVFILWAAVFPPDMQPGYGTNFGQTKNYIVFGDRDKYYPEDKIVKETGQIKKAGLNFEIRKFDGEHTIDSATLLNILSEI